jgi:hypothetical protein
MRNRIPIPRRTDPFPYSNTEIASQMYIRVFRTHKMKQAAFAYTVALDTEHHPYQRIIFQKILLHS